MPNIFDELRDKPEGVYVRFTEKRIEMEDADAPDQNDDGFWPSLDPEAAGWVGENPTKSFEQQMEAAELRMAHWREGHWGYVGVRARATIYHKCGSTITSYEGIESSGLWGIESDSDESYFIEVYDDQCEELRDLFKGMGNVTEL